MNPNKIILCGGKSCCPEINFDNDGNAVLTDDFGGSVKLTAEEVSILTEQLAQRTQTVVADACCNGGTCCGQ